MLKKLKPFYIILAICMLISSASAASINDLKKELDNTKKEINGIASKLKATENEKKSAEYQINQLDSKMVTLSEEKSSLESIVSEFEQKILLKENEIEETKSTIALSNDLLEQRLRVMYKNGAVGYMEVLFDANDINDFLTRIDMIQRIIDNDVTVLEDLEKKQTELNIAQLELKNEKNNYYIALEDVEKKKKDVESASREKEVLINSLTSTIEGLKEQEAIFLKDSNDLEKKIQRAQLEMKYAGGEMTWPAPGYFTITSPYGMRPDPIYGYWSMHSGIDIRVSMNQKIAAANAGVVSYAGWYGAYGNLVIVDHGGGISTVYGHNTKLIVSEGQKVTKGQQISYSGTTGMSTGPHLHFEVRINGVRTDPMAYFK